MYFYKKTVIDLASEKGNNEIKNLLLDYKASHKRKRGRPPKDNKDVNNSKDRKKK